MDVIYPKENYCIICNEHDCMCICEDCEKKIRKCIIKKSDIFYLNKFKISSYAYYGGVIKKLILKLKYENDFTAGELLSRLLVEYILENIDYHNFVISYIPMSNRSKRIRGFNQCEYIGKKISKRLSIKCIKVLIKEKNNREQKTLCKSERFENVQGIFSINNKINISGLSIILIDDVVTSGATMIEAYKILKKYGAKEIKLLTLAKSDI